MSRTIELPDDVYQDLERTARDQGVTPAAWIAAALPLHTVQPPNPSISERLKDLLGAVDSTQAVRTCDPRMPFGEIIARKLERQGLRGR